MKKFDPLAEYLKDVNSFHASPEQKINKMVRSMTKNIEQTLIKIMVLSIGIYTTKVALEQLLMQWRIHF